MERSLFYGDEKVDGLWQSIRRIYIHLNGSQPRVSVIAQLFDSAEVLMVALCNVLVPNLLPFEFHRVDVNEYMQIAKIEEDTFEIRIISCPPTASGGKIGATIGGYVTLTL
jgi:hypothetical protein